MAVHTASTRANSPSSILDINGLLFFISSCRHVCMYICMYTLSSKIRISRFPLCCTSSSLQWCLQFSLLQRTCNHPSVLCSAFIHISNDPIDIPSSNGRISASLPVFLASWVSAQTGVRSRTITRYAKSAGCANGTTTRRVASDWP